MTTLILVLIAAAIVFVLYKLNQRRQIAFIEAYTFHPAIARKVRETYPDLDDRQLDQVFEALREYFYICHKAGRHMVSMPSQVVDVAWHEFILFTRPYELFCRRALGRFLHHTPAEAMSSPTWAREGIKRAWRIACARHRIDPAAPAVLPPLFAIDAALGIEDGFTYRLDCLDSSVPRSSRQFCAGHIGCAAGCAGGGGAADGGGGVFGGDGDGGSCGSGCGGGCGGS